MRVAVYARFSSANQRDTSIDDQVRICMQFAATNDWDVVPDLIFTDYSVSAACLARDGFDRLYGLAKGTPRGVDIILTENTDRLSRDLGDADRFYKRLAFAGVRLICVNDGIDSAQKGARMTFSMKAMMADWFLEDLRDKTLRGLQGQANRGFSTGGLPFGYRSEPVGDPKKPDGFRVFLDDEAAATLLRIFEMYRDGCSYRIIAKTLNEDGVPPPRAKTKHRRKGWIASSIREMLSNTAYIGQWSYQKREWRKVPGTNRRLSKARPDGEVLKFERPELRIVPTPLWNEVQERRAAVAAKYASGNDKGRGAPGRRTSYPFSGLLACGLCGAPMVIMGGSSARYYKCGDVHKRGTCANPLSVREGVLREALLLELERLLTSSETVALAKKRLQQKLGESARSNDKERLRLNRKLDKIEGQSTRLVTFIMDNACDAATLIPVKESLTRLQKERESIEEQLAQLEHQRDEPIELPGIDDVRRVVFNLKELLVSDPIRAREALRRFFKDGTIVLDPQDDGTYIARSQILPLMTIPAVQRKKPRSGSNEASGSNVYSVGCAGRI